MKKILLSLFVGFVGIISFCSAVKVENLIENVAEGDIVLSASTSQSLKTLQPSEYGVYCLNIQTYTASSPWNSVQFSCNSQVAGGGNYLDFYQDQTPGIICLKCNQRYLVLTNSYTYDFNIGYSLYNLDVLLDTECPVSSQSDCESEYNLIPIEEVDSNYCIDNNLCPSSDLNWSSLFINDIQHESSENINIFIPEEFSWDYNRTDENFDLTVSGYNVDTEYIASIIQTQNSKPSQEDLNKLVSEVLPLFIPGLAIILLIYFIFRFIKKVF